MNDQRNVIYSQRRDILLADNSYDFFKRNMEESVYNTLDLVQNYDDDELKLKESLKDELKKNLGIVIKDITSHEKEEIKKVMRNISRVLDEKIEQIGHSNFNLIIKQIIIQVLDQQWKLHLLALDNLRQGID